MQRRATPSTSMTISPAEARSDPRNAHLPLLNEPRTILGTTITFLVCGSPPSTILTAPTDSQIQSLAIIAASLRLWSRFRDRLWGWDDAFVFLSGLASIAGDSVVCLSTLIPSCGIVRADIRAVPYDGLGLHFYTLSAANKEAYFKVSCVSFLFDECGLMIFTARVVQ